MKPIKINAQLIDMVIAKRNYQDKQDNLKCAGLGIPSITPYSRTTLANELGMSRANLHLIIKNGRCLPDRLSDIAKHLGLDEDQLIA